MTGQIKSNWYIRLALGGAAAALALSAATVMSSPAQARVFVSVGVPCCGYYYGPGPYYGYPPPYYYAPPPGYYPPPPDYYPPPPAASGYTPPATSAYAPPATGATAAPAITYTSKPPFTNSAGQTCREYKTMDGGRDVFGTACQQADGQWRVVN